MVKSKPNSRAQTPQPVKGVTKTDTPKSAPASKRKSLRIQQEDGDVELLSAADLKAALFEKKGMNLRQKSAASPKTTPAKKAPQTPVQAKKTPQAQASAKKTPKTEVPANKTPQKPPKTPQTPVQVKKTPKTEVQAKKTPQKTPKTPHTPVQVKKTPKTSVSDKKSATTPKSNKKNIPLKVQMDDSDDDDDDDDDEEIDDDDLDSEDVMGLDDDDEDDDEDDEDEEEEEEEVEKPKKATNGVAVKPQKTNSEDERTLFLKNLPPVATVPNLKALSKDVTEVRLRVSVSGTRKYAYLVFTSEAIAEKNYKLLQKKSLEGQALFVDFVGSKSKLKQKGKHSTDGALDNKRLFVSGLGSHFADKDLHALFPEATDALAIRRKNGNTIGYGFVSFRDEKTAGKYLLKYQNGKVIGDKTIIAVYAKVRSNKGSKNKQQNAGQTKPGADLDKKKLYVAGLAPKVTDLDLKKVFTGATDIFVMKPRADRPGYAFVSFRSEEQAETGLKNSQGKTIGGHAVKVVYANKTSNTAVLKRKSTVEDKESVPTKKVKSTKKVEDDDEEGDDYEEGDDMDDDDDDEDDDDMDDDDDDDDDDESD